MASAGPVPVLAAAPVTVLLAVGREGPVASPDRMGSLIKKRRKRMRKKKHKKMLKRTRFQRRNK
jgi:hypothetical protein